MRAEVEHGGACRIAKGTAVVVPVCRGPGVARGCVARATSSEAGVVVVVAPEVVGLTRAFGGRWFSLRHLLRDYLCDWLEPHPKLSGK